MRNSLRGRGSSLVIGEEGSGRKYVSVNSADLRIEMKGSNKVKDILEFNMTGGAQGTVAQLMVTLCAGRSETGAERLDNIS